MVKLPGESDLGFVRADPTRPTGTFDATPIAAGAAKIAAGATALGQGIAKAGEGVGELAVDENKWQYAKAHSDFTAKKIDLDAAIGKDDNYGPDKAGKDLPTRYTEQLNGIRASSAGMIQSGPMRDMFISQSQPAFEQGVVAAQAHARSLSNEAQVGYVGEMGDKAINQAVAAKDDATRAQVIDAHNQLIDGLSSSGAITDAKAREMKQAWAHQYATADMLQRSDEDPQGVINELRAKPGSPDSVTNRIISIEGQAKNARSSAQGVGQFIDGTWLDMVKSHRPDLAAGRSDQDILLLRNDKSLARDMVTAYQQDNAASLKSAGLEASPGNVYLAHFLGPGGAKAVLQAPPNMPVADALSKALGPDKAKAMIDANPSILQGQLAGSVKSWADGKMGGSAGGEGTIYDMLRPDVRAQILSHAQTQLQKQTTTDLTGFKAAIEDSQAEASRTGNVKTPLQLSDFITHLGADLGPKAYQNYSANIQVSKDVTRVATLNPSEMQELVNTYDPKPGEGFAAQSERQDLIKKAVASSMKERQDDPAGFAVARLPASGDAYKAYSTVQSDMTKTPAERGQAARSFASTTLLEQQGAGIPGLNRQILPAADVERFKSAMTTAQTSDDPKIRTGLIKQIQAQKEMWGDYWPDVVRQLTPSMQPMVRAIAAGADTQAMTRLLSLDPKENPKAVLKEQSETKASDLTKALNTEMAPLLSTMVGVQKERDFFDYYNLADKLSALYVRDGKDASTAARDAFNALIGNRYEFRDTYRIPKDPKISADDVQAGAMIAKNQLTAPGPQGNLLEQARAQYPVLKNQDYGYVENFKPNAGFLEHWEPGEPGEAPSPEKPLEALRPKELAMEKAGLEIRDPKTRPIDILGDVVSHNLVNTDPTVKQAYEKLQRSMTPAQQDILKDQYAHAQKNEGEERSFDEWKRAAGMPAFFRGYTFQQWPKEFNERAYTPEQRADLDNLMGYLSKGGTSVAQRSGLLVRPASDDVGGLSGGAEDSVAKFRRDGVWVTSPDNAGLNMMHNDKAVRNVDGSPLFLSWSRLAQLGGNKDAREAATRQAVEASIAP